MSIFARLRAGVQTSSAAETQALAEAFAPLLPLDVTLALHGDLGVGKTTFVQGLARGFGIQNTVTSPTFTIFNVYRGRERSLVHFDAYRLTSAQSLDSLMLEDFLVSPFCLAVEWPERVTADLPLNTWHLHLAIENEKLHHIKLVE